ncbi:hypothetical protein KY092_04560 [Natronomonas gomsonensis]|uniref:hypothetical protein n=1 Tax=Natronomonas gomsonensis TaxID=1046043 RepID=UPI0020CA8848|nr:hypothetical protein [Natronomonas gomsonensis]MCY4729828.1 hypothetical protein [Natronomonas gomsonensis]
MDAREESSESSDGRSLGWGWAGSLLVVALAAVVLVAAALRTPGGPACEAYTASGRALLCPWYRAYLREAALLFAAVGVAAIPLGLAVGFTRVLLGSS